MNKYFIAGIICLLSLLWHACSNNDNETTGDNLHTEQNYNPVKQRLNDFQDLSSRELLDKSIECIQNDSLIDLSRTWLSTVINRYYNNPSDTIAIKNAVEAFRLLANLNMSYDIDYKKAYKYLTQAKQLAQEENDNFALSFIFMSLINLYHMNETQTSDFHQTVNNLLRDGITVASASNNEIAMACLIIDMGMLNESEENWGDLQDMAEIADKFNFNTDNKYGAIARFTLDAFNAYFNGEYNKAEKYLTQAELNVEGLRFSERLLFPISSFRIRNFQKAKDYEDATYLALNLLNRAKNNDLKDYELWMNKLLTEIYTQRAMPDSADYYHSGYLKIEESMKKENGYETLQSLEFVSQIEDINSEIQKLSYKRQQSERQNIFFLSLIIILIIVIASLLFFYLSLRKNHLILYKRNEEMMKREKQHAILRNKWEQENSQLLKQLNSGDIQQNISSDLSNDNSEEDNKNDSLENEKNELTPIYAGILTKMEESEEIYNQGFSLSALASMLNLPARVISKAINVCHGSNFHQLLNEYRIREAIKRLHDPSSANLTIESIAESVGFKSRTSFATLFKKSTGLTPSEYLRMAQNDELTKI